MIVGTEAGMATAPKQEPQTARELNTLDKAQTHLSEVISQLESRLSPILRKDPEGKDKAKEEQNLCDLAGDIRNKRKITDNQIGAIESILSRIEL